MPRHGRFRHLPAGRYRADPPSAAHEVSETPADLFAAWEAALRGESVKCVEIRS